jgi:hypothetical protein
MPVTISELPELSGDLSQSDPLVILDVSAGATKKIQAGNLLQVGISGAPSGFIDLAKLNQNSATKLSSTALANTGVSGATYGTASQVASFVVNTKGLITAASGVPIVITASSVTGLATVATSGTYSSLTGRPTLGTLSSQDAGNVLISGGTIAGIVDLAIADGGTGSSTASGARVNLGLAIGSNVQAYDAGLASIAGLTTTADQFIYTTAADTYATAQLPAYMRQLIGSGSSASVARTTLGLGTLSVRNSVEAGDITNGTVSGATIASSTITSANMASNSVVTAAIASGAVTTVCIADDGVTAAKLADNSATIVSGGTPIANGSFIGQRQYDSSQGLDYIWNGSTWEREAGLGTLAFTGSTPLAFAVSYPDRYSASIATSLNAQTANTVFAGPASGASAAPGFRALVSEDLPLATSGSPGAVSPGAGLTTTAGVINHSNATTAGTYTGSITIDGQGHIVSAAAALTADNIPPLDASKITTGTFSSAFLADNSVTAAQLADYGIAQVTEELPVPEFAGQWWIHPTERSASVWVGVVSPEPNGYWLNVGYASPEQLNLRFGGTYNASGNTVSSLNSAGLEAGLAIGSPLPAPNESNNGVYLIVTTAGTGVTPAPVESLVVGNWVLSEGTGSNWKTVALTSSLGTVNDQSVLVAGGSLVPAASGIATQENFNDSVWGKVQIANTTTAGIVRASSQVLVASGTGIMTIGEIDDGTY